jgi:hypothetical protein
MGAGYRMMGQKRRIVLGTASVLLCSFPAYAQAVVLPDGKGKAEFVHNCVGVCHRAEMVVASRKTPEDWRKSVDDMAARGTDGTKEDLDNVVLYLVTNYSTGKGAPAAQPAVPASPHPAALLSPADFQRMRTMLVQNSSPQPAWAPRIVASNTR